jgi:DeoR/GlpR family transcriptional regulator of sugar metabolism
MLAARSFWRTAELAKKLGTSISTVRRDLNDLQADGVVQRTHGGVVFLGGKNALPVFRDRQSSSAPDKQAIGRFGAAMVSDGETVIIDGGTTPYQVALALQEKNVQIITNSLPVANLFSDSRNVQLLSTGGVLYPGTGVYLGPHANNSLKDVSANKAFLGVAGIGDRRIFGPARE